jgi:uncharacterized tellurite resistance protein B-like protein
MHILVGILGAVFAVALVIWRISVVIQAGKTVVSATRDAKAALRRRGWSHRAAARPLDAIDDPKLIAAVILMASIRCDREITQEDRDRMTAEMQRAFRVDRKEAMDLAGEAEFLVRDIADYPRWAGRLAAALVPKCSAEERAQVLEMAAILGPGGAPSERRQLLLTRYRDGARLD